MSATPHRRRVAVLISGRGSNMQALVAAASDPAYPVERLTPPTRAETAIHAVWRGNRLLTPIGGGVTVHPRMAIDAPNLIMDEKGQVKSAHAAAKDLPSDAWYWD